MVLPAEKALAAPGLPLIVEPHDSSSNGRLIGATDRRGEDAVERRVGPPDFLATIYHRLGIDYGRVMLSAFSGQPVPIVHDGQAPPGLVVGP